MSWGNTTEDNKEDGQLREEFEDIRDKYNLNVALQLQSYLDKWLYGISGGEIEDDDIGERE